MKIRYEFTNGEVVEVEVDETLGAEIAAIEHKQSNRNRAETRRHNSLEDMLSRAYQFSANDCVAEAVENALAVEKVRWAVSQLSPQQRRLVHYLYGEGLSYSEAGRREGVGKDAIYLRHERIKKKLRKILS